MNFDVTYSWRSGAMEKVEDTLIVNLNRDLGPEGVLVIQKHRELVTFDVAMAGRHASYEFSLRELTVVAGAIEDTAVQIREGVAKQVCLKHPEGDKPGLWLRFTGYERHMIGTFLLDQAEPPAQLEPDRGRWCFVEQMYQFRVFVCNLCSVSLKQR